MCKVKNPKLVNNNSTGTYINHILLTFVDLENGDRRVICPSGYFDVPHDSIHNTNCEPLRVQKITSLFY